MTNIRKTEAFLREQFANCTFMHRDAKGNISKTYYKSLKIELIDKIIPDRI